MASKTISDVAVSRGEHFLLPQLICSNTFFTIDSPVRGLSGSAVVQLCLLAK